MAKKKIGVLNFQYSTHNYGAVLQAAALEFMLKHRGHYAEHINFIPKSRKQVVKSYIKKVLVKARLIKPRQKRVFGNSEAFERFRQSFLNRSGLVSSPREFEALAKKYDAVIVGSDQVWRPRMAGDPAAFFLTYVPDGVDRIAYAASFGASSWEAPLTAKVTKLAKVQLPKFKAISCRETSGADICRSLFRVEARHVLDPLLQVDDTFIGGVIAQAKPSSHKLVYYKLDQDEAFQSSLKSLEKEYSAKAHDIYRRQSKYDEYEEVDQWLRLIHDSDVVVSDSFHCICLALRFDKIVYYYPNPVRGQARLDDLFRYLKIDVTQSAVNGGEKFMVLRKSDSSKRALRKLQLDSDEFLELI